MSIREETPPAPPSTWANLHGIVVILLLLFGLMGVYASQLTTQWTDAPGAVGASGNSYVADLDFWQRTGQETTAFTAAYFDLEHDLSQVPLTVGDWVGKEMPETNREVEILLEPEQYVRRLYQHRDGQYLWLSLIAGRSSQPFHPPDICYDADGWQFNMSSHAFALDGGGALHALWLEAQKPDPNRATPLEHVVSYFYLFPNAQRDLADGIVLFKLTSDRYNSAAETLLLHEDFVRSLFTSAQER